MAFTKTIEELIREDTSGLLSKHDSWKRVAVSDIAEVINGYAFKSSFFNTKEEGLPLIRIRDVVSGATETFYTGPYDKEYIIQNGDFLIGMDGDFNCAFWRSGDALLNQRVCKVQLESEHYSMKWLAYLMPQYLNAINQHTSSMTVKHLSSKTINSIQLPLPPQNEQTRIVEKLEELLSDLDNGVAELKAAQVKLNQYRQSLLKSAVEGTLTKQWREENADSISESGEQLLARILKERRVRWEAQKEAEFETKGKKPPKNWKEKYPEPVAPDTSELPKLPEGWVWASVAQISQIQGGIQKQPKRIPLENKYPFLRVANVYRNRLKLDEIHEIELFEGELEKFKLELNDILIVEGNGSKSEIGRCALWDDSIENAVHQNHLIRTRPITIDSAYLLHWLNSPMGIEFMSNLAATTSGLYTLSVSKISKIPVPLPPLNEQIVISNLINTGIDDINHQYSATTSSLRQSEAQRRNILKDAFSGKLVSQDPNDEPASELLKRIQKERAERVKQPKPKRSRKKSDVMKTDINSVRDWINKQDESFTFEQLSQANNSDYDSLQQIMFDLLAEKPATVEQVFDEEKQYIIFRKVSK